VKENGNSGFIKRMKNIQKILFLLMILILYNCKISDGKLFWINETETNNNDFLFMAESTNVLPITDSLTYYLTKKEVFAAEKVVFKNFGKIYENENFKVNVLLRIGSQTGRDYKFIIRTFGKNSKIIDSYELAEWNEQDKRFCFGSIDKKLIITKSCKNSNEKDVKKIANDGRIIATSYHGRK
jgi:hypothetical protein